MKLKSKVDSGAICRLTYVRGLSSNCTETYTKAVSVAV
jgi:hypothetical protein